MKVRILAAALAALCLALAPTPAAAGTHPFSGVLAAGTPFAVPPPFPAPNLQPFDDACGVALDAAGYRYVSDYHHRFVAVFNAADEYVTRFPSPESDNAPCDLAVDSAGRLYANDLHQAVVRLRPAPATIDSGRSTGVAVGPGDSVYVAHRDHVSVYGAGGAPLLATIGSGALTDAYGVAVSGAGHVYVADAATDTVKVFDPATPATPIQTIDGSGTPAGHFTDLTDADLAISPASGNLLLTDNLQPGFEHPLAAVEEFDPSGAYVAQISHWKTIDSAGGLAVVTPHSLIAAQPTGLALGAGGEIYVTSGNEEGSVLYGFGAGALASARVQVSRVGSGAGTVTSQLSGVDPAAFTGIECGLLCATEFEAGEAVTFKATPAPHSTFAGWSVPGQPGCAASPSCRFQLFGTTEMTATFTAIAQARLTVGKSGAGAGTLASAPLGLDCGPTCTASFDQGTKVTLSAEAAPGSEFTGFSGACSGTGACQLTLGSDTALSANFRPLDRPAPIDRGQSPRTLAIVLSGSGSGTVTSDAAGIQCGTPCSGSYAPGTHLTLTASADGESHFGGWSGCDSVAGNRCSVTLTASRTLSAGFVEGPALALGALKVKGAAAILAVSVPGPGTLSAAAKWLRAAKLSVKRAGTVSLPLALSKAGKRALAKRGKLAVGVQVTFKPSGGEAAISLATTVTFKSPRKR